MNTLTTDSSKLLESLQKYRHFFVRGDCGGVEAGCTESLVKYTLWIVDVGSVYHNLQKKPKDKTLINYNVTESNANPFGSAMEYK